MRGTRAAGQGGERLTDRVKAGLITLISTQKLGPGDKLPTAEQLCRQFSVSRTVVREAVATLQAEGRLVSLRGSGVYVSEPAASAGGSLIMGAPQNLADVIELMELRLSVEIEAAALAAQRRTETDLLRIEQAQANFTRQIENNTLASEADRALHLAIAEATGNGRFSQFVNEMGDRLIPRRALGAAFADADEQTAFLRTIDAEHQVIVGAIADRDAETARAGMRQHLENGRRRYRNWGLASGGGA